MAEDKTTNGELQEVKKLKTDVANIYNQLPFNEKWVYYLAACYSTGNLPFDIRGNNGFLGLDHRTMTEVPNILNLLPAGCAFCDSMTHEQRLAYVNDQFARFEAIKVQTVFLTNKDLQETFK